MQIHTCSTQHAAIGTKVTRWAGGRQALEVKSRARRRRKWSYAPLCNEALVRKFFWRGFCGLRNEAAAPCGWGRSQLSKQRDRPRLHRALGAASRTRKRSGSGWRTTVAQSHKEPSAHRLLRTLTSASLSREFLLQWEPRPRLRGRERAAAQPRLHAHLIDAAGRKSWVTEVLIYSCCMCPK